MGQPGERPHREVTGAGGTAPGMPGKLAGTLEALRLVTDRGERIQILIDIARRFRRVPDRIAVRPYPADHLVPACESQAYVWAENRPDGTLDFHFAVENPQGISAMATSVILGESLSGAPLEQVVKVPREIVYEIFGDELSMGKSMGLMGIVSMVLSYAKQKLGQASPL
jgi:cysteine desulfuration protein SufE